MTLALFCYYFLRQYGVSHAQTQALLGEALWNADRHRKRRERAPATCEYCGDQGRYENAAGQLVPCLACTALPEEGGQE